MANQIPSDVAEALQTAEGYAKFQQANPIPSGLVGPFDPQAQNPYFSMAAYLSRFGAAGQYLGEAADRGMHRYAPGMGQLGVLRGRQVGQFAADTNHFLAMSALQTQHQQAVGAFYQNYAQGMGLDQGVAERLGGLVSKSRFRGSLLYGGDLGEEGLLGLLQAASNGSNRYTPTTGDVSGVYGAFSQYYGVTSMTRRTGAAARAAANLSNTELAGVWAAAGGMSTRSFFEVGGTALAQARERLAKGGKAPSDQEVYQELGALDILNMGGGAGEQTTALGARLSGADQFANQLNTLRTVGRSSQDLMTSLNQITDIFGIGKLDRHKMTKAAEDMSAIAAAAGSTFDNMVSMFETVGAQMKGAGLTTKLRAAGSYGFAMSRTGALELSGADRSALGALTTGVNVDVAGSNMALMMGALGAVTGDPSQLTPESYYNLMGMSSEEIRKRYQGQQGETLAAMVSAARRGDYRTMQNLSAANESALESEVANAKTPEQLEALKRRWGSRVSVMGGEARVSHEYLRATGRAARAEFEGQTGRNMLDSGLTAGIRGAMGLQDLTEEQVLGVVGLLDPNLETTPAALKQALVTAGLSEDQISRLNLTDESVARMRQQAMISAENQFGARSGDFFRVARAATVGARYTSDTEAKGVRRISEEMKRRETAADASVNQLRDLLSGKNKDATAVEKTRALLSGLQLTTTNLDAVAASASDPATQKRYAEAAKELKAAKAELASLDPTAGDYSSKSAEVQARVGKILDGLTPVAAKAYEEHSGGHTSQRDRAADQGPMKIEGTLKIEGSTGFLSAFQITPAVTTR